MAPKATQIEPPMLGPAGVFFPCQMNSASAPPPPAADAQTVADGYAGKKPRAERELSQLDDENAFDNEDTPLLDGEPIKTTEVPTGAAAAAAPPPPPPAISPTNFWPKAIPSLDEVRVFWVLF